MPIKTRYFWNVFTFLNLKSYQRERFETHCDTPFIPLSNTDRKILAKIGINVG